MAVGRETGRHIWVILKWHNQQAWVTFTWGKLGGKWDKDTFKVPGWNNQTEGIATSKLRERLKKKKFVPLKEEDRKDSFGLNALKTSLPTKMVMD